MALFTGTKAFKLKKLTRLALGSIVLWLMILSKTTEAQHSQKDGAFPEKTRDQAQDLLDSLSRGYTHISTNLLARAIPKRTTAEVTLQKRKNKRRYYFPLLGPPLMPFTQDGREFGATRDWGTRLHAGVDLLEYAGNPVFAVTDGRIIDYDYFYDGTDAVVVHHGEFVVRYGEVRQMYGTLKVGDAVHAGEKIALIATLYSSGKSMLHFEKFSGKLRGSLTNTSRYPYQRRQDLINPTRFIRSLEGTYPPS